jgi:hypothetical protein
MAKKAPTALFFAAAGLRRSTSLQTHRRDEQLLLRFANPVAVVVQDNSRYNNAACNKAFSRFLGTNLCQAGT